MDDRTFFEEQILAHLSDLLGGALRLAKNRDDAEDLVAETAAKAWEHRADLLERDRFRPWIFRILTNTFISRCRKRTERPSSDTIDGAREGEDGDYSLFEELHQPFLLWWSTPEKEFLNKILREDMEKAIDALPETFRVVVILSELEGFSYHEMADILKVPVGTIRSRLARGRGLLQKALSEHAKERGLIPAERRATSAERHHEENQNHRL